jgi:hypothetical protein
VGRLAYGAIPRTISIDDRLLAHIEVVVLSRLRRNNAFALRWTEAGGEQPGRRTIWIHQGTDLCFEYDAAEQGELDRELLDQLAKAADSNGGINLRTDAREVPAG